MATAEETLSGKVVSAVTGVPQDTEAALPLDSPDWVHSLVEQHLRRVLTVLYRIVGNYADAQDLAQEVFLKAFQRRHQLRDPARVLPWLMRIASNAGIDFRRSRGIAAASRSWNEAIDVGPPSPSPEQQLFQRERERRLQDGLRLLSPKERAAIVMRDLEGMSGAEVARALGCSPITVRTHIASARIKLRRFFQGKDLRGTDG